MLHRPEFTPAGCPLECLPGTVDRTATRWRSAHRRSNRRPPLLEWVYGETQEARRRYAPRDSRHADPPNAAARTGARPHHRTRLGRYFAGGARVALSSAAPSWRIAG